MSDDPQKIKDRRQAEVESNAEYQRRKFQMTRDDKAMDARDRIAKNLHDQNMRDNKKSTFNQALEKATEIANRVHREKQEKGEA